MLKSVDETQHNYCVPTQRNLGLPEIYASSNPNTMCDNEDGGGDDINSQIRDELIKQLKEHKFYERLIQKLDKGEYKWRKDHMLRRMQMEKNEKDFQDCMCLHEKERTRMNEEWCEKERIEAQEREQRDEEVRESAFKKQLKNCAPELRELERQIRRSYYAKTLYAQRLEGDALKVEEKMRERQTYEMMMDQIEAYDKREKDKIQGEFAKRKEYIKELKNQMETLGSKTEAQRDELKKDKIMIDQIISLVKQEEMQDLKEKCDKVKLYQSEIDHFLKSRDKYRGQQKEREQDEEKRRVQYLKQKEADVAQFKKAKEESAAAKAAIVARAIERMMKEQFKNEEIEELRQELLEEELKAELRQRELDDLNKKHRQMMELKEAAANAIRLREERLNHEKQEEDDYRKQLMYKFSEDERLEQFSNQKRKQREREHRKQVEQMIYERRCIRAQEKEKDQHVLDCLNKETERRQNIIDQERIRLLKAHGPQILGFIPRGVIKSKEELEALGEPYISYYTNPPKERDPTTYETEPC